MRFFILFLPVTSALLLTGCAFETRKVEVQGAVSFEGAPLSEGDIFFVSETNAGDRSAGKIKEGRFSVPVSPGKKRVEIRASRIKPGGEIGAMGEPVAEDYIPDRFNTQSILTAEVTPARANKIDFDLK